MKTIIYYQTRQVTQGFRLQIKTKYNYILLLFLGLFFPPAAYSGLYISLLNIGRLIGRLPQLPVYNVVTIVQHATIVTQHFHACYATEGVGPLYLIAIRNYIFHSWISSTKYLKLNKRKDLKPISASKTVIGENHGPNIPLFRIVSHTQLFVRERHPIQVTTV